MPLSAALEELVKELEKIDPAAAKAQRELLEKHAVLQKPLEDGVLRQTEFSRKMNDMQKDVDYGKTMKKWADDNVPKYDTIKKERDDAVAEQERLKAEIKKQTEAAAAAALAAGDGKGFDPKAVAAAVFAKIQEEGGFASKTEIADEIKKVTESVDKARTAFFETTFPQAAKWQSEMTSVQLQYRDEAGKLLDMTAFSKFMTDGKFTSPAAAFEKFMEPERTAKKNQADAEKRFNDLMAERGKNTFPGSSGEPGHLQVRMAKKDSKDTLFSQDVSLGDGSLAAAAAAELNNEGK